MGKWKACVCTVEAEGVREPGVQILGGKIPKTEEKPKCNKCLSSKVVKTKSYHWYL